MGLHSPYPQVKNESATNAQELMEHEAVADKKCEHPEQFLKMTNNKVMSITYTELFLGIKPKRDLYSVFLFCCPKQPYYNFRICILYKNKSHHLHANVSVWLGNMESQSWSTKATAMVAELKRKKTGFF